MGNGSADRLRNMFEADGRIALRDEFDRALRIERQTVISRIRERLDAGPPGWEKVPNLASVDLEWVRSILDEQDG